MSILIMISIIGIGIDIDLLDGIFPIKVWNIENETIFKTSLEVEFELKEFICTAWRFATERAHKRDTEECRCHSDDRAISTPSSAYFRKWSQIFETWALLQRKQCQATAWLVSDGVLTSCNVPPRWHAWHAWRLKSSSLLEKHFHVSSSIFRVSMPGA